MRKPAKHSKTKATLRYLRVITLLCVMALIDDVALGFLSNMNGYLHIQPAKVASAATSSSPVLASQ